MEINNLAAYSHQPSTETSLSVRLFGFNFSISKEWAFASRETGIETNPCMKTVHESLN